MQIVLLRRQNAQAWFSGADIQAHSTAKALRALGYQVHLGFPLPEARYDLVHAFGTIPDYLPLLQEAKRRGARIALSPIFFKDISTPMKRFGVATAPFWGALSRRHQTLRRLFLLADCLLPNTQAERDQVGHYFRIPAKTFVVVPNGVDPRFAEGDPRAFRETFGIKGDFVLTVGRIERRKNQLRLIQALKGTGIPLVVIGRSIAQAYLERCQAVGGEQVLFLPPLAHDDPLLASAYACCRVFALPSLLETPGLSALEAGVAGARIVVTPNGGAREYFGDYAFYPNPRSVQAIREAILEAWDTPIDKEAQRRHLLSQFSWQEVAEQTATVYQHLLEQ